MKMVNAKFNGNSFKSPFTGFPFASKSALVQPGDRILNLATDADYEYLKIFGYNRQTQYDFSVALQAANANINETLNVVEGLYESSLNITFNVVFQYGWMYQDPFNNYDTVEHDAYFVLDAFKNWWNTYRPAGTNGRNAAILFTGKPGVSLNLAYQPSVCSNPEFAYAMIVGNFPSAGYGNYRYGALAHEISHLFNAGHISQSDLDANPDCYNSIQGASDPNRPFFGALRVCQLTINQINTHLTFNSCLLTEQ